MNDCQIFKTGGLLHHLEEGERVEADDGYKFLDPQFVKNPSGIHHPEERKVIRNGIIDCQKPINKRNNQLEILAQIFRHVLEKHQFF